MRNNASESGCACTHTMVGEAAMLRTFRDDSGLEWHVWDVQPQATISLVAAPPEMSNGWLAFQSGAERRRLYPIPSEWHNRSESDLTRLCNAAQSVARLPEYDALYPDQAQVLP